MDPLDYASDRAMGYQRLGDEISSAAVRALTAAELETLADRLLNTDLPVPQALSAMHIDVRQLCIDDLDRLALIIARCRECQTWTRLSELVVTTCPECWGEMDGAQNAPQ